MSARAVKNPNGTREDRRVKASLHLGSRAGKIIGAIKPLADVLQRTDSLDQKANGIASLQKVIMLSRDDKIKITALSNRVKCFPLILWLFNLCNVCLYTKQAFR